MNTQLVKIGALSREAKVPVSTIRFYIGLGLLKPTSSTGGGYQLFDMQSALAKLRRIRDLQQHDRLRLAEIREQFEKEDGL